MRKVKEKNTAFLDKVCSPKKKRSKWEKNLKKSNKKISVYIIL